VATKPEDPKADKPEADAGEPSKVTPKSKKMILIIVVALLVLGLAGGAGWYFFIKKNEHADEDATEVVEAEPEPEVHRGPPTYLPLDNMVVNLANPGGEKFAQVAVTLELSDAKATEKVKVYLPAIRSGVLLLISQRTSEELLQIEGKQKLAADILAEASRHFESDSSHGKADAAKAKKKKSIDEENPVRGVLFSNFIVQ
jgi:flagellar FliL protein